VPVFRLDARRVRTVASGGGATRGDVSGPEDR
jgi:hypothetical protein